MNKRKSSDSLILGASSSSRCNVHCVLYSTYVIFCMKEISKFLLEKKVEFSKKWLTYSIGENKQAYNFSVVSWMKEDTIFSSNMVYNITKEWKKNSSLTIDVNHEIIGMMQQTINEMEQSIYVSSLFTTFCIWKA